MKTKLAILFSILISSCDVHDERLKVVNLLTAEITLSPQLDTVPQFPSINKTEYYLSDTLYPEDTARLIQEGMEDAWPFFISESVNDKLNLFVYNVDTLKKYQSIDTLIRRKLYTRYSRSKNELEKSDWIVIIND